MTATYHRHGVQFLYPENWTVGDEQMLDWPRTVSLQSPGTGFWSLHVYCPPVNPYDLAIEVMKTMREEYDDIDVDLKHEEIEGQPTVGYNMDFHCMDLLVHAQVRGLTVGNCTYLLLFQAEDREFEQLHQVFLAITASLIRGLTP